MATVAIASFIVIVAVAISGGFRKELREGIASICGDIRITSSDLDYVAADSPLSISLHTLDSVSAFHGIRKVVPAVYRAGIVKSGDNIDGVVFKGIPGGGDSLAVSIPSTLADMLSLSVGDKLLSYFISGERVQARTFRVASVYEDLMGGKDRMIVYAGIGDMRRLNGWKEGESSAIELVVDDKMRSSDKLDELTSEVGALLLEGRGDDGDALVASSSINMYPEIFSWLELIDFNVLFILVLMTVVAGFNMISALLIILFRNIQVIGILKSMGMKDRPIVGIFLRVGAAAVLKGMLVGNLLAFAFCLIQDKTHLIRLDPDNYFVSFVPVSVNPLYAIGADLICAAVIIALMLLPCLFVSGVDPAKTVRSQ